LEPAGKLPQSKEDIFTIEELIERLQPLIGEKFPYQGNSRGDGSTLRKIVARQLELDFPPSYKYVPTEDSSYSITEIKGFPKIIRHMITTHIATPEYKNKKYNLQVWNYNPNFPDNPLIFKSDGEVLFTYKDLRGVIAWVNRLTHIIESITIFTPERIQEVYGKFGKETVKHQMIINDNIRREITTSESKLILGKEMLSPAFEDSSKVYKGLSSGDNQLFKKIPDQELLYSIKDLGKRLSTALIGQKIDQTVTRLSGSSLEYLTLKALGYNVQNSDSLEGLFPDIRHQLLEVKVQRRQTVDLGKFSPLEVVDVPGMDITPEYIRYLFVLVNDNDIIDGIILMYGKELPNFYHFVPEKSYKCQRNIKTEKIYSEHIGQLSCII
jgi:hypothetical protein